MTKTPVDYVARAKAALDLLNKESSWFAHNRAESEEEGYNSEEDLGGRFLVVLSDNDAEAKDFTVFYKTLGTLNEVTRELSVLLENEMWLYAVFDLEIQVRLEIDDVTISFKESLPVAPV